jgi:hypothetical protein
MFASHNLYNGAHLNIDKPKSKVRHCLESNMLITLKGPLCFSQVRNSHIIRRGHRT